MLEELKSLKDVLIDYQNYYEEIFLEEKDFIKQSMRLVENFDINDDLKEYIKEKDEKALFGRSYDRYLKSYKEYSKAKEAIGLLTNLEKIMESGMLSDNLDDVEWAKDAYVRLSRTGWILEMLSKLIYNHRFRPHPDSIEYVSYAGFPDEVLEPIYNNIKENPSYLDYEDDVYENRINDLRKMLPEELINESGLDIYYWSLLLETHMIHKYYPNQRRIETVVDHIKKSK